MSKSDPVMLKELERLRVIEHLAWHVAESSDDWEDHFLVDAKDFRALCKALPEAHPSHGALPMRRSNPTRKP